MATAHLEGNQAAAAAGVPFTSHSVQLPPAEAHTQAAPAAVIDTGRPPALMLPPPSPAAALVPSIIASPSRARCGSVTVGHAAGAALPSPRHGDGAGFGGSSLADHLPRTASLPVMMGSGAVLPSGSSAAIPIAIAGVGASNRARASTVHTPAAVPAGSVGAGASGPVASMPFRDRSFAQSVDQHFMQQHLAMQAAPQQQHHFFHQSDGGAPASSPAHFIGSASPVGPSFHVPFAGAPAGAPAAATTSPEDEATGPQPHSGRPDAASAGGGGWLLGSQQTAPTARERSSFDRARDAATVQAVAEEEEEPPEEHPDDDDGDDLMDGASSLASSGYGRAPHRNAAAPEPLATHAAHAAHTDEDGDEEFEDAVEIQHDDDDHVYYYAGAPDHPERDTLGGHARAHGHSEALDVSQHAAHMRRTDYPSAASPDRLINGAVLRRHGASGLLPMGGGVYPTEGGGLEEEEDEGETLIEGEHPEHRAVVVVGQAGAKEDVDDHLLEEEDEEEEEEEEEAEEEDEEEAYVGGGAGAAGNGAGWGAGGAGALPYLSTYALEPHTCVNCTRPFWGAACRYCGHPADTEVVTPELLAAAVQCVAEGAAATAAAAAAAAERAQAEPQQGAGGSGRPSGVLLAYDDRCRAHLEEEEPGDKGRSHPERPERVAAIMVRLQVAGLLARFERITGRDATMAELVAAHDANLVSELERATEEAAREAARRVGAPPPPQEDESDMGVVDMFGARRSSYILDCYFNASTAACARLAAGSAAEVACRVVSGAARHGAAIIRPPGHHAETSVAMGFCYYNNAAVAARAAQAAGARRVVIMDWDVHHGNGTQRIFYDDPSVLYISTHRYDGGTFYPGTGGSEEVGERAGLGFTVNVPWNGSGVRDADMLAAFRHVVVPVAEEFRPDLVIISAGFDAVEGDPLGGCRVTPPAFGHFAAQLSALAPTVLLLEGGYNLTATAAATEACLRVLLGEAPAPLPAQQAEAAAPGAEADAWVAAGLEGVSESAMESLRRVLRVQGQYWQSAREHQSVVEAAVEDRRQRQVAHMQAQQAAAAAAAAQRAAQDPWGWRFQVATPSPPPPPPPPSVLQPHVQVEVASATPAPVAEVYGHPAQQPLSPLREVEAQGQRQGPGAFKDGEGEHGGQRRMDLGTAGGSMEYGEVPFLGDTQME